MRCGRYSYHTMLQRGRKWATDPTTGAPLNLMRHCARNACRHTRSSRQRWRQTMYSRAPADVLLLDHYDWNLTPDDERLRYFLDSDFSVEGDSADAGGTSTQSIRGVASTFVRSMWTACNSARARTPPSQCHTPSHCQGVDGACQGPRRARGPAVGDPHRPPPQLC